MLPYCTFILILYRINLYSLNLSLEVYMTRINPLYLNDLSYLNSMIDRILFELNNTYSNPNYNFWYEPITGLFYLIPDNFSSNLQSFYNTIFENDLFGFCGVKKIYDAILKLILIYITLLMILVIIKVIYICLNSNTTSI